MVNSENQSSIRRYFQTKLAVVEVHNGETQDDAWRRYLTDHPENAGAEVKIFHYPGTKSIVTGKGKFRNPPVT